MSINDCCFAKENLSITYNQQPRKLYNIEQQTLEKKRIEYIQNR